MRQWIAKYKHAWILSYGLIYLSWFFYLEHNITQLTDYHVIHTKLDDMIPFCEYFIVPYLLWFAYIAAAVLYFFFVNKDDYYRLCAFLFTGMTISLVICSFWPNGTDFRPVLDADKNIFTAAVARLYSVDTCTNVFPSIHVFNSIGVHIAIAKSENIKHMKHGRLLQGASFVLMLSICMATVCLKQHSIVDVAGACLMALPIYGFVYAHAAERAAETAQQERARRGIRKRGLANR